jgi:hypothetical protein
MTRLLLRCLLLDWLRDNHINMFIGANVATASAELP